VADVSDVDLVAQNGIWVARVRGEIDMSNADATLATLVQAIDENASALVVDLSELEYLDSAGVRLLFTLVRKVEERNGRLRAVVPRGAQIRRVLELADVGQLISLDETAEEAIEHLHS
jgi:anti-anti-sigma factor